MTKTMTIMTTIKLGPTINPILICSLLQMWFTWLVFEGSAPVKVLFDAGVIFDASSKVSFDVKVLFDAFAILCESLEMTDDDNDDDDDNYDNDNNSNDKGI